MKNLGFPSGKFVLLAFVILLTGQGVWAVEVRTLSGNAVDVKPKLNGPVIELGGGARLVREAIQQTINDVRGCADCNTKLDVVFLAWKANEQDFVPNLDSFFGRMNGVDSVETIIFDGKDRPSDEAVKAVENAEIIYFSGGRQCDYIMGLRGKMESAIEKVYRRGGGIGGMSAGQAIQGSFVFDGCSAAKGEKGGVTSELALKDPYHEKISFSYGFFDWKFLRRTLTDQHFGERDRMGRVFAFLVRQIVEGRAKAAHAIAVDEESSVVVDRNGIATVFGESNAYFITADHKPEVCKKGRPLSYSNFKIWKLSSGKSFNLGIRPKDGYYSVDVVNGKLSKNPY